MSELLHAVHERAQERDHAENAFRQALREARREHSWQELADAAGMSRAGVRWLTQNTPRERNEQT